MRRAGAALSGAALAAALLAPPASAEGLEGRTLVFRVETIDAAGTPLLTSRDYVARVEDGAEIAMGPEGWMGLDVVPVTLDLAAGSVTFTWPEAGTSVFYESAFNGYVMEFAGECALISRAEVAESTMPLPEDALEAGPLSLRLDVSGMAYGPDQRVVLAGEVADCPIS